MNLLIRGYTACKFSGYWQGFSVQKLLIFVKFFTILSLPHGKSQRKMWVCDCVGLTFLLVSMLQRRRKRSNHSDLGWTKDFAIYGYWQFNYNSLLAEE